MTVVIGIDPGKKTGLAFYVDGRLDELDTCDGKSVSSVILRNDVGLVVMEDSRLQTYFPRKGQTAYVQSKITRDVGGIDALCREIERLCDEKKIPVACISPRQKGRKLNAGEFLAVTGWAGRTNQHERDAALVAWPFRHAK